MLTVRPAGFLAQNKDGLGSDTLHNCDKSTEVLVLGLNIQIIIFEGIPSLKPVGGISVISDPSEKLRCSENYGYVLDVLVVG